MGPASGCRDSKMARSAFFDGDVAANTSGQHAESVPAARFAIERAWRGLNSNP